MFYLFFPQMGGSFCPATPCVFAASAAAIYIPTPDVASEGRTPKEIGSKKQAKF
jgi:hypothetical protein